MGFVSKLGVGPPKQWDVLGFPSKGPKGGTVQKEESDTPGCQEKEKRGELLSGAFGLVLCLSGAPEP